MNLQLTKIASNLNVAVSTVHRTLAYFEQNVSVHKQPGIGKWNHCLTDEEELLVIGLVFEKPQYVFGRISSKN